MIRFKDLLLESNFEDDIDKLISLFETGNWIVRKPLLYRGTDTDVYGFQVREPRTRKSTRDTRDHSSNLVNCIHRTIIPEYPDRMNSAFTTFDDLITRDYGKRVYFVFPHKSAKISWSESDAWWTYFRNADKKLSSLRDVWNGGDLVLPDDDLEVIDQLEQLFEALAEAANGDCSYLDEYVRIYGSPFHDLSVFEEYFDRYDETRNHFVDMMLKVVKVYGDYLDDIHLGYPPSKDFYEAVVEGKYIYVHQNFFDEHVTKLSRFF